MKTLLAALLFASLAWSQQTVNGGRTTLGPVDNSGATHTRPMIVVANTGALPATGCNPGELAVVTGATLGQQIYQNSGTGACTWTQQLNSGTATGGGITMYSGTAITVTANTYYIPVGGGGTPSTTETNVDIDSPAAATITNMYVQLSVALGVGNTGVFTFRKNATSQSVTCTVSGGSSTSCSDTTHSFNVSQGDLLAVQLVTTGTIVVTPNILIAAQFGNITATGTVNTGTANQLAFYQSSGAAISANPSAHPIAVPLNCSAASASGTTYTCTSSPTFTPAAGDEILFKADVANTGAATLNVNSAGAAAIDKQGCGTALVANDLLANQWTVLVYTGTVWCFPGLGNAAAAGSFTLVEQHTASNSAALTFTTCPSNGTYDTFYITMSSLIPVTQGANLILEFSTDGGATWDSTSGHYSDAIWVYRSGGTANGGAGNSATNIAFTQTALTAGIGNTAARGLSGDFLLTNLASQNAQVVAKITWFDGNNTNWLGGGVNGAYQQTTNPTAFRLRMDSGNVNAGVARCYGLSH